MSKLTKPAPESVKAQPENPYRFDVLFLVGTTADHKPEEFGAAAWINQAILRLRMGFMPQKWFALHPSTIEIGQTGGEIVGLKARDVEAGFSDLRPGHFLHEPFARVLRDEQIIPFEERRVYSICDDSTIMVPKKVLEKAAVILATKGSSIVNPNLLYSNFEHKTLKGAVEKIDGEEYIHVIDSGPLWTHATHNVFFNALREAAHELKLREVPIYDCLNCTIRCMDDPPELKPEPLKTAVKQYLYMPGGTEKPIPPPVDAALYYTYHYLCTANEPTKPIADNLDAYFAKRSPRAKMVEQFAAYVLKRNNAAHSKSFRLDAAENSGRRKNRTASLVRDWKVVQPTFGNVDKRWTKNIVGRDYRVRARFLEDADVLFNSLSLKFAFGKKMKGGKSFYELPDGILLPPFDRHDPLARAHMRLMFDAAIVARQLGFTGPIQVLNLQDADGVGCYDEFISSKFDLINHGYAKSHIRTPFLENRLDPIITDERVAHIPSFLCDILTSPGADALESASRKIFDWRFGKYFRLTRPLAKDTPPTGELPPSKMYGMTVYSSATSDKHVLNGFASRMSITLVHLGIRMVIGGCNRYLNGVFPFVYKQAGGKHLMVDSTPEIVNIENENGELPPAEMWALRDTLGQRTIDLFDYGNAGTALPGGFGTALEIGLHLVAHLRKAAGLALGPLSRIPGKKLFLFDPYPYRTSPYAPKDAAHMSGSVIQPVVDSIMGRGTYDAMLIEKDSCAKMGLYLTTRFRDWVEYVTKDCHDFNRHHRVKKVVPGIAPKV